MSEQSAGQRSFAAMARHLEALDEGAAAHTTSARHAPAALQQGGPESSQPQANIEEIGHDL